MIDKQSVSCYSLLERGRKKYVQTFGETWNPGVKPSGSRERCPVCKFKIRGKHHEDGDHHNKCVRPHKSKSSKSRF